MTKHFWKTAGAALMCASMLAGCSNTPASNNNSSTGGSSSAPAGDTVKIGLNFELTGNVADYGTKEINGAKIAVQQFNAREDKPFTVETVEFDDKGEPAESVAAITKLIDQDGVVGVVGPATSASSIATYEFASSKQVPVMSPSATQVDAMLKGDGSAYEYAWRVCFEDSYQGKGMADYAIETLGAKKAVVLNEVSDYGAGLANAFSDEFAAKGGEVVDRVEYQAGDKDFASFITKIKDKDFDVMYIGGYYNEAAQIVKAAKAAVNPNITPIARPPDFERAIADAAMIPNPAAIVIIPTPNIINDLADACICFAVVFVVFPRAFSPSETLNNFPAMPPIPLLANPAIPFVNAVIPGTNVFTILKDL